MKCKTDGLGRSCVQTKFPAMHCDPRTKQIRKVRELDAYEVLQIGSAALVATEQVLVGRERLDALTESTGKVFGITSRGLPGDYLDSSVNVTLAG
jgi:hypothetical protein